MIIQFSVLRTKTCWTILWNIDVIFTTRKTVTRSWPGPPFVVSANAVYNPLFKLIETFFMHRPFLYIYWSISLGSDNIYISSTTNGNNSTNRDILYHTFYFLQRPLSAFKLNRHSKAITGSASTLHIEMLFLFYLALEETAAAEKIRIGMRLFSSWSNLERGQPTYMSAIIPSIGHYFLLPFLHCR